MHALRVLEFEAIRDRLQIHCETAIGAAQASELQPSFDDDTVWRQLALTTEAYDLLSKHSVPPLGAIRDLRQPLVRAQKGGTLGGQELYFIAEALAAMRNLRTFLNGRREEAKLFWNHAELLPEIPRLESTLFDSLDGDGTVKDSASATLASLRQKKKSTASRIQERIQSYTTGSTRDLLSDPIYTMRDGRYVIPVKSENRGKIRGIVHDTSGSGQTIYVEPEDVLQLGNALREAEAAERAEEARILASLSSKVGAIAKQASDGIESSGVIDFLLSRAKLGFQMKATMPLRAEAASIEIQGGKHPLLDPAIAIPLELTIGRDPQSVLITGPNTGGKTVSIKTVGLFVLMAQSGLMVPALHVRLGVFSQVWADIGDEQSLQQSLSTFSGHIKNIAEALRTMKSGALVLLDEVGAGTDPAEGAALARAILLEMQKKGAVILASTHYGELKAFAYNTAGFRNAAMEFDPKTLHPTYRLLMGAPGASQALRIAERYGIPKEVVEAAREGLSEQHQDVARMMEQLDRAQRQARIAQGEADRRLAELRKSEAAAQKKLEEAEEIRQKVSAKGNAVIEDALREIRLEAARLFDELKKAGNQTPAQAEVRTKLKELQEVGQDFASEFAPKPKKGRAADRPKIEKGMSVKIDGYTQIGNVLELKGDSAVVQMGIMKMTIPVTSITPAQKSPSAERARPNIRLQKAQTATTEIHLRHMRAESAIEELERFIDDAMLAGLPSVRIVHGKGEGVLRKVTQEYLKRNPGVATVRDGEPAEGGSGVTIATFR